MRALGGWSRTRTWALLARPGGTRGGRPPCSCALCVGGVVRTACSMRKGKCDRRTRAAPTCSCYQRRTYVAAEFNRRVGRHAMSYPSLRPRPKTRGELRPGTLSETDGRIEATALRRLDRHEALCTNYGPDELLAWPVQKRRERLASAWGLGSGLAGVHAAVGGWKGLGGWPLRLAHRPLIPGGSLGALFGLRCRLA